MLSFGLKSLSSSLVFAGAPRVDLLAFAWAVAWAAAWTVLDILHKFMGRDGFLRGCSKLPMARVVGAVTVMKNAVLPSHRIQFVRLEETTQAKPKSNYSEYKI